MDVKLACIDVNGVPLHVAEAGPKHGRLVILLHGFPEYWEAWQRYFEPLAAAGYHVVAPDQRGYNQSDKPSEVAAYDLNTLAADVLGLADHLGDVASLSWVMIGEGLSAGGSRPAMLSASNSSSS